jgi:hypothetical protein
VRTGCNSSVDGLHKSAGSKGYARLGGVAAWMLRHVDQRRLYSYFSGWLVFHARADDQDA